MNHHALRWHWLGLASLGLLVGYFVALSESPVVGTVLPLLFGVIAGISGFILGKTDFRSPESIQRVRFWGIGFFAFALSVLGASLIGIFAKNYVVRPSVESLDLSALDANVAADIVGLRRKLEILGATPDEQNQILARATVRSTERRSAQEDTALVVATFLPSAARVNEALERAITSESRWSEETLELLKQVSAITKTSLAVLNNWERAENPSLDEAGVSLILVTAHGVLNEAIGLPNADSQRLLEISRDPNLAGALFQMKAVLDQWTHASGIVGSGDPYSAVDKLTELLVTGKPPAPEPFSLFARNSGSRELGGV